MFVLLFLAGRGHNLKNWIQTLKIKFYFLKSIFNIKSISNKVTKCVCADFLPFVLADQVDPVNE